MAPSKMDQHNAQRAVRTLDSTALPYPEADATADEKARWSAKRYSDQDGVYEGHYHTWSEIIAFLRGRHWDRWAPGVRQMLPETDVPPWRKRLTANYVFAIWKTFVAKLTKNRPAWEVRPASGDLRDINAARLAQNVLEWLWTNEMKMSRTWRRIVSWVVTTGNCWVEVFWDNNTGNEVELTVPVQVPMPDGTFIEMEAAADPETGEPLVDPQTGMPLDVEPETADLGQVGLAVHAPYAVRTNPEGYSDPEAVTDVMVGVIVSRDWFIRVYGEEMAGRVDWGNSSVLQNAIQNLESIATGGHRDARYQTFQATSLDARQDTTLLIRHYHKPDSEFPDGRFWVAADNGVMVEDEQPLPLGIWPLVHVTAYPNPGLLLSPSPIEPVIPLNRRLNEQNSKIAEHEDLMVQGKWLVPKTANIRRGAITSEPAEVIEYTPPFEPKMADIKALPAAVYSERETTKADMQFVSGMHKVSLGQPPPGVTAGKAFLVLQEADDTDLGPILSSLSDALSDIGYLVLWTVRHFYDEERVVASSSADAGEWMYRDFVGQDLDPVGRGGLALQVKVQEGSMFPWLQSAAQEVAIQFLQTPAGQAFVMDPETGVVDNAKLSRFLQVGGLENIVEANDVDVSEAERIYDDLARWEPSDPVPQPVPEWQNIPKHIARFQNHLKSAAFNALPPPNQQLIFQYYSQLLAIQSQQAAEAQQAAIEQAIAVAQAESQGEKMGELAALQAAGINPRDVEVPSRRRESDNS